MVNRLTNNPELTRQAWLELTLNRSVMMVIVQAVVYLLVYLTVDSDELAITLQMAALTMFSIVMLIWGTKNASEAVISEINDQTWDSQKLTLLSASKMAIGKLFGSTIYQWYGGILCMIGYFLFSLFGENPVDDIKVGLLFMIMVVFVHASAITMSLMGIRKNRHKTKIKSTFYFLVSLMLAWYMGSLVVQTRAFDEVPFQWFFIEFDLANFALLSILFYATWAIVGLYRSMRTEFQYANGPGVWLVFLISLMFYSTGIFFSEYLDEVPFEINYTMIALYMAAMIPLGFTYIMAFSEPKYIVDFRLMVDHFKSRNWKGLWTILPLWLVSLAVFATTCLLIAVIFPSVSLDQDYFGRVIEIDFHLSRLYPISLLLFVVRDIGLLLFLNLKDQAKRADLMMLVYLLLLYVLLPGIVTSADGLLLLSVFWPLPSSNILMGVLPILVQVAVVWYLLYNRYRKNVPERLAIG
jgi:hypothetical protein